MLSNDVVRKINRQIEDELRNVDSLGSDHEEKMQALERIAKLKELLMPQPSRMDILTELADALKSARDRDSRPQSRIDDPIDQLKRLFVR